MIQDESMKILGVLMVLVGIACFVLPLLGVYVAWLWQLGSARAILAFVLILIGAGIFFFSGGD